MLAFFGGTQNQSFIWRKQLSSKILNQAGFPEGDIFSASELKQQNYSKPPLVGAASAEAKVGERYEKIRTNNKRIRDCKQGTKIRKPGEIYSKKLSVDKTWKIFKEQTQEKKRVRLTRILKQ